MISFGLYIDRCIFWSTVDMTYGLFYSYVSKQRLGKSDRAEAEQKTGVSKHENKIGWDLLWVW